MAIITITGIGRRDVEWLDNVHPIYRCNKQRWLQNEARLLGGDAVIDELQPFEWEQLRGAGTNYGYRQDQAVYPNFADDFLTVTTGHLLRFAPKPDAGLDFGGLGQVRRGRQSRPSNAELVYFSTNSPGLTGLPWDAFWDGVTKRAGATGHRWLYCETPADAPLTQADELTKRPYLTEWSPLDVPNWQFSPEGHLNFMVIRFCVPADDQAVSNVVDARHYLLLVREGFTGFGEAFMGGGWFRFDDSKRLYDSGTFDDTDGEIPAWPHFWEQSAGTYRHPAMSRPSITELGAAGIAYMNIESAANFDAWDAAKSIEWLSGIDDTGYTLARSKLQAGSRWIPLPPNEDTDQNPSVDHGSGGAVQQATFTARLQGIRQTAVQLGVSEISSMVGAGSNPLTHTGASKNASFSERQVPRIVKVATNLGISQNTAIYFLEKRWGVSHPSGATNWPDRIDLVELVDKLQSFFEVERIAGIRSPTIDAKAMTMVAVQKGIILSDEEQQTATKEYTKSAKQRDTLEQQGALNATLTGPRSAGPGTGSKPQQNPRTAAKSANREALKKAGKGGPKRNVGGR